ncbi:hypothetical protein ACXR0O_23420 [Verrucomicrobiota bacterium sgz303538]
MAVRFARSYVDRLYAERDFYGLYHVISVIGSERLLPEEFWLFCRVYELVPARSGVWQYYEGLTDSEFERMSEALDRFGLVELAHQYRHGRSTWDGPTQAEEVDEWLDAHTREVHDAIFDLILQSKECLTDES